MTALKVTVGVDPPTRKNDWSEHIAKLKKNKSKWLRFEFDDIELGYKFYRRIQSERKLNIESSVENKGAVVKAVLRD